MTEADVVKEYNKLEKLIDKEMDDAMELVDLEHKKLKDALKEQIGLQMLWESLTTRAKYLKEVSEDIKEEFQSAAIVSLMRDSHRTTTITEAKIFANADPDYKRYKRFHQKVVNLYETSKGVNETITSRKYILNNLTNAVVASVENQII